MNIDEGRPLQRLLAFDTSTSSLAVAVMENGRLLAERNIHAERNHSAYLVTAIDEALSSAGIRKNELDAIAVGVGPGSYTGIRIAVTTAKTLAWALKLPVYSVSSLEALGLGGWASGVAQDAAALGAAIYDNVDVDEQSDERLNDQANGQFYEQRSEQSNERQNDQLNDQLNDQPSEQSNKQASNEQFHEQSTNEQWVVPLVDARRGQVYTSCFVASKDRMPKRMEQDGIRLMKNWSHELADKLSMLDPENRPTAIWFVGEVLPAHEETAQEALVSFGIDLHFAPYELEGVWIGLTGTNRALTGSSDEVHSLEPNYTQLAEAEVQAKAKLKAAEANINTIHNG
ncbi:tRNA threonylcarbamoyladenosine biosynthesis protein TsaB [compost metagenome]